MTMAEYDLPLVVALGAVMFVTWWRHRKDVDKITRELEQAHDLAEQREHERDLAQEELFRRLYEEKELNKEKTQFQSQLMDYEKYAALAQLALGAAHEINNPLLGILSHLELELNDHQDSEQRLEIEQCIAGARRISSTLRGLVSYARPGPLVLSKMNLQRLASDTITFIEHQPLLRGKHLGNEIPADLPCIRADANQLSQVLMNLLLNAAEDATAQEGTRDGLASQVPSRAPLLLAPDKMSSMLQLPLRRAVCKDVDAIVRLVNLAFLAESPYITGERIDADGVRVMFGKGVFLLAEQADALVACVFVSPRGERAHLGLVSVAPDRQGAGLGSQLMAGAEAHCRAAGYREMELRFINHRTELLRFYRKLGFAETGMTEQMPDTSRIKVPFHFVQMCKRLV